MISSGIFVVIQFAAFSLVGALLWSYNKGQTFKELRPGEQGDNLYPSFILHALPVGHLGSAGGRHPRRRDGLAVLRAELDVELHRRRLHPRFFRKVPSDDVDAPARPGDDPGLGGADGGLRLRVQLQHRKRLPDRFDHRRLHLRGAARAFLLGRLIKRANQVDAVIAFLVTVAVMTYIVRYVKIDVTTAGTTTPPPSPRSGWSRSAS